VCGIRACRSSPCARSFAAGSYSAARPLRGIIGPAAANDRDLPRRGARARELVPVERVPGARRIDRTSSLASRTTAQSSKNSTRRKSSVSGRSRSIVDSAAQSRSASASSNAPPTITTTRSGESFTSNDMKFCLFTILHFAGARTPFVVAIGLPDNVAAPTMSKLQIGTPRIPDEGRAVAAWGPIRDLKRPGTQPSAM
jgi:hypothetical protein